MKTTFLKTILAGACFFVSALAAGAPQAEADEYPSKPITMIVPFTAGGPTDLLARLTADAIREGLDTPVVVENMPGAGGTVAARAAARKAADGYTLMFGTGGTHALNGLLYADPGYDPLADFDAVAGVASSPNLLVVNAALPVETVKELIAYAKAHPNSLTFGSGGFGTSTHLSGEMFKRMAGIEIKHVPYTGTAPALADLAGGHISMVFDSIGTAVGHVSGGKVRPLAVTTPERSKLRPEIPAIREVGLPEFDVTVYYGLFAPAGTPRDIINELNQAVNAYLKKPEVEERFQKLGMAVFNESPEFFDQRMDNEQAIWKPIMDEANIQIN